MNRRAVMGMAGALLIPRAFAEPRRDDGGVYKRPHIPPRLLTADDVDTLMWPIVERINRSGWVWTMESCQGHIKGHSPMLGVVTSDPRFFVLWAQAAREAKPALSDREDPLGLWSYTALYSQPVRAARELGSMQVRIGLQPRRKVDGDDVLVLQRLAELVTP